MAQRMVVGRIRAFLLIWCGQLVSLIGSGLTGFALGVWVYQQTESATLFTLITVCTMLPDLVVSPLAGALVDRWDRRWAMILSDAGAGLSTLVIALLLLTDRLALWHIYLAMAVSSTFVAFQLPAYAASITLLVPKQHLGRASGMTYIGKAAAHTLGPLLGAMLLVTIHIHGVILIDVATFAFAVVTLLIVRIPKPKPTEAGSLGKGSLLRESAYGWTYIMARPGLLGLLLFFVTHNLLTGVATVLVTPLVLAFAPVSVLGTVLAIGGGGFLLGSLVMSLWGGPRRHIYGVFGTGLVRGMCILAMGLSASPVLIAVAVGLFYFNLPIIAGCSQAIWQKKVAPDVQGRVFAIRRMIAWSSYPLAYCIAGPLADYVFEPLLVAGGLLAGSIGQIIGVGPGRGIGLLCIIAGTLCVCQTATSCLYPRLRLVDEELPDVLDNGPHGIPART